MKKRFSSLYLPYLPILGVFLLFFPTTSNAYVLKSNKVSHPKDAYYWIENEFSTYGLKSEIKRGLTAWNSLPEIQFTKEVTTVGGADVKMEYVNSLYGDVYAVHRTQGNITFYKNWRTDLRVLQKEKKQQYMKLGTRLV
ncbi:hypothetical protein [Bacillus sp. AFS053548]|uniref:hypothetical protein n=1 Tax=Bacillus sp. AFS053548 TaxID=2033505 RepID=UPI0025702156|nr:hypothetical protein [Bacillus sp. AFS053548]